MINAFEVLRQRGFIYQATEGVEDFLKETTATFYIGFDPTADSLHVGSLVPLMAMLHLQRAGHRPIALVGSGTAQVGDPSGKTEMRQLLKRDQIAANAEGLRAQFGHFIDFADGRALLLDNAAWLERLGYIEFLRDIGPHFRVNAMLQKESVRLRLESEHGISFLEFNYMLLQAYDFYVLARDQNCQMQLGGQDQYGNITAGIELIHKLTGKRAYGITFPLLTDATGQKFGKTVAGAVWLSARRTSPYEYYQFWRNSADSDVARNLLLFTLLPFDETQRLASLEGQRLNRAKEILAYEATALIHGPAAAAEAFQAAVREFGSADADGSVPTSSAVARLKADSAANIPTFAVTVDRLEGGIRLLDLFVETGLVESLAAARRLMRQGGAYLNEARLDDEGRRLLVADFVADEAKLRAGKKQRLRLTLTR